MEYHGLLGLGVGSTTPSLKVVNVKKILTAATGQKYIEGPSKVEGSHGRSVECAVLT
jgi:hypothetical protein